MRTIAYDVIGVNVFLLTLMRFLLKKEVNSVRPILLTYTLRSTEGNKLHTGLLSHDIIVSEALTICRQLFDMVELSHLKTFK